MAAEVPSSYQAAPAGGTAEAASPDPGIAAAEPLALTAPAPEPEPEPEPTLQEQLRLAGDLTSSDYALASLFDAWGIEYRTGGRGACAQAEAAGLACLSQRGSLAGLALIDRPAILTLVDDAGERHDVTLTGIDGERVELSIGGVPVTHTISEITRTWFGDFLMLWRPPTGSVVTLSLGSQGPAVTWLRDSLAAIDDRYVASGALPEVFDAEVEEVVRTFQRDHRLVVDGVAGRQTQIIINSLLAADNVPRLSMVASAQD